MANETTTGKKKKGLPSQIVPWVALGLGVIATIAAYIFTNEIFGEKSVFYQAVSGNDTVNMLFSKIPSLIRSVQIVTISVVIYLLVKLILGKAFAKDNKGLTVVRLITSFLKYLIAIIALFMVLGAWGVDTTTLLASLGILGLIIGLGAQSLIGDVIAGVFIIFEGEYQIGDIIVVDGWRGTVQEIGIRCTKLEDAGGNIKIVNNSAITSLINQTKDLSLARCVMSISYNFPLAKAEVVIRDNLERVKKNIPQIVEGPFYKGVDELADSSVNLLFLAKCKEEDIYQVERDLNRELMIILNENNIEIPFPQIVVNEASDSDPSASKETQKQANAFKKDQAVVSKKVEQENSDSN